MELRGLGASFYVRAGAIITASTVVLTAAFVGVVALAARGTVGVDERFPFYVLAMAVTFVASLLVLDDQDIPGVSVIGATIGLSFTAFVVLGLAAEGVVYAIENPDVVVASPLLAYFVSAGLIATGLTYWGLNHWREFVGGGSTGHSMK